MIDDEEPTAQHAVTETQVESNLSATIQVPVVPENCILPTQPESTVPHIPIEPVVATPSLPYMDIDDILSLRLVGDPQLSPDGMFIVFTVLQCHSEQNTAGTAIWIVSSAGGKTNQPRRLTNGEAHDTAPRWSPDGHSLAFLSDRSGIPQIYLISMDGGEACQLSSLPQGISEFSWRSDGQLLLAHSAWKPEDEQSIPITSSSLTVYTRLQGKQDNRYQQIWLIALDGTTQRLTSEPVDLLQSCWSPDGTEIVFCANRRSDPDLSASTAVWVMNLATGQLRRLTPEEGSAYMPSWSPDGQSIAYLYSADQTDAGNISPWIVDAQGKTTPHLAVQKADTLTCQAWIIDELHDDWLVRPVWYPDGKALLVPAQERGQLHLYRLDMEHNTLLHLTNGSGRYSNPQISKDGTLITLVRADWFTPGDIWSMDSEGKKLRKLTKVNDTFLQSHQLIRPKSITWKSFDDLEIEGWLYLPALAEQTKAPLILAPHGGPHLAWGNSYVHEFQLLAGRGYAILAPNPRGSAGYGDEFSRRILNDWGGADFQDLMAGVDHVIATEPVDGQRLGISGMSYGGYMTNRAITQTDRFKAAVSRNSISSIASASLLSNHTLLYSSVMADETLKQQRSALPFADDIKTPLLLLHAQNDLNCPFAESLQLFVSLRKRKHLVELIAYQNTGHLMDWPTVGTPQQRIDRLRRTLGWFERFI